jgi:hypothetical protein
VCLPTRDTRVSCSVSSWKPISIFFPDAFADVPRNCEHNSFRIPNDQIGDATIITRHKSWSNASEQSCITTDALTHRRFVSNGCENDSVPTCCCRNSHSWSTTKTRTDINTALPFSFGICSDCIRCSHLCYHFVRASTTSQRKIP